jgi:prevent-host-death family protein
MARMSKSINIHEAKTHLSRLVEQAALGKVIVIAKAGKPMARLMPMEVSPRPKKFDLLKSRIKVPDDFNAPLEPGLLALFKGS